MAVNWSLQSTWDACYKITIGDPAHPLFGQSVGYSRLGMARVMGPYTDSLDLYHQRRGWLIARGMLPADRILIAGCGLGFLIESFKDEGYPNVWGIDSSPWIEQKRPTEARGDVLWVNADMRGGAATRNALRQLTGANTFDWVISESLMEGYTNAEIPVLLNAAESVLASGRPLTNIIHMVVANPALNPMFNVKTLVQWKAMRPTHSWMSAETGATL